MLLALSMHSFNVLCCVGDRRDVLCCVGLGVVRALYVSGALVHAHGVTLS